MKHAYLIMAHNEPQLLAILVRRLKQDSRNDVIVHIDKKVRGAAYKALERATIEGGGDDIPQAFKHILGRFLPDSTRDDFVRGGLQE